MAMSVNRFGSLYLLILIPSWGNGPGHFVSFKALDNLSATGVSRQATQ